MKVGGKYNWKGQPERLVYLGIKHYPDNGFWFQFAKVDEPDKVWSEVREADLAMFEETVEPVAEPPMAKFFTPGPFHPKSQLRLQIEIWNADVEARKAEKKARKASRLEGK